jgi:hypothetical protein
MLTSRAERIDPPQTGAEHGMTDPENPNTRGSTATNTTTIVPARMLNVLARSKKKKHDLQRRKGRIAFSFTRCSR